MNFNVAVIKGDGIGPEIVDQAVRVLDAAAEKSGHEFTYKQILMGGHPLTPMENLSQRRHWRLPETVMQS